MTCLNRLTICSGIFLLFSLFCSHKLYASSGELVFETEHCSIDVYAFDRYTTEYFVEGVNNSTDEFSVSFRVPQSVSVSEIVVMTDANGKFKKLNMKDRLTISTMDWSAFFTGSQTYSIYLPANCNFTINYTLENSNTLFLSQFSKTGIFGATTHTCRINLPEGLTLSTHTGQHYTGQNITLDSNAYTAGDRLYTLVHPVNTDPQLYFSDWFTEKIAALSVIEPALLPASLETIYQSGNREELAKACFRFVQNEIRYVAIENGINAIVPRPASQTLYNKYGDCKDMSNLLYTLLKHYGFEAYLGVSRTFIKSDTFNFPSVSMANHMIVALRLGDEFIYLDATEDECLFGDPSFQIMGTETFLLGKKDQFFMSVPATLKHPGEMHCDYRFEHRPSGETTLSVKLTATGKLNRLFYSLQRDNKLTESTLTSYLSHLFPFKFRVIESVVCDTSGSISLTAVFPANQVSEIGSNTYIDLSLLPDPKQFALFFNGTDEPTFAAYYQFVFYGLGAPKTHVSEQIVLTQPADGSFSIRFPITKETLKKDGELQRFWTSFTTKPFILQL